MRHSALILLAHLWIIACASTRHATDTGAPLPTPTAAAQAYFERGGTSVRAAFQLPPALQEQDRCHLWARFLIQQVDERGDIVRYRILQRSGDAAFDAAAIATVQAFVSREHGSRRLPAPDPAVIAEVNRTGFYFDLDGSVQAGRSVPCELVAAHLAPGTPPQPEGMHLGDRVARLSVRFHISATGSVDDVDVESSDAPDVNAAAVASLRQIRFVPARERGVPVASEYSMKVVYRGEPERPDQYVASVAGTCSLDDVRAYLSELDASIAQCWSGKPGEQSGKWVVLEWNTDANGLVGAIESRDVGGSDGSERSCVTLVVRYQLKERPIPGPCSVKWSFRLDARN